MEKDLKIIEQYRILKIIDSKTVYVFRVGSFYIFVEEDAVKIADILDLKLTDFGETFKCGFPVVALEKYTNKLYENRIVFYIVENEKVIFDILEIEIKRELELSLELELINVIMGKVKLMTVNSFKEMNNSIGVDLCNLKKMLATSSN